MTPGFRLCRDLKLENILMAADGTVKLSDFGLGSLQEAGGDGLLRTVCGTPNYAAPEVLLQQPYDGSAADLWSLGAVANVCRLCLLQTSSQTLRSLRGWVVLVRLHTLRCGCLADCSAA